MVRMSASSILYMYSCLLVAAVSVTCSSAFTTVSVRPRVSGSSASQLQAVVQIGQPTELPDSLDDAAARAAAACAEFSAQGGRRCRVDFDTSIGDETFTMLKQSTEFMIQYVAAVSYAMIPGLMEQRQSEIMAVANAKAELKALGEEEDSSSSTSEDGDDNDAKEAKEAKEDALVQLIANDGRANNAAKWTGDIVRVYFPDEGSAALARRDWAPKVPPCVQFSSCGGVQQQNVDSDALVFFFCPRASESVSVEEILARTESSAERLKLVTFVNPVLVDMGVTGFGMAGRMLRERLIDPLTGIYYLRTLPWGALTRQWPGCFTVWQEDAAESSGYRLIKTMDRLPSNPEVEDIYDVENGNMDERQSGGFLDQFGDFVNGMMSL